MPSASVMFRQTDGSNLSLRQKFIFWNIFTVSTKIRHWH